MSRRQSRAPFSEAIDKSPRRDLGPAAEWPRLRSAASFQPGEVIWRSDEVPSALHRVLSGRVRLLRASTGGGTALHCVLGPGGVFGMVAPGGAVQIAVADGAEVWRSHSADLEGLCRSEPLAAAELASRLGESIERERRRIERLVSLEVPQLVCRALIDLSRVHGRPCRHGGQLDLVGFTQQQLGDLVGSCRPFVSTHINKLRRRQILGHSGRVTCILDLERLKGAAGLLTPT